MEKNVERNWKKKIGGRRAGKSFVGGEKKSREEKFGKLAEKVGREKAALRCPNGKIRCLMLPIRPVSLKVLNVTNKAGCRHSRREAPLYVVSIEVATIFRARYSAREKS